MTYSFNNAIPAANNNPSTDQPDMLINNISTAAILAVDHIGFNVTNGGQHKSIHFNQDASYVPVPPVSPPQLFTKTVSALPQLFYYSGTAAQSSNQYNQAANFSTFLLGGLILKGGSITMTSTAAFTYAGLVPALEPFPNATLGVYLTPAAGSANNGNYLVSAISATGFTVVNSGISSKTYYFLAIGY